MGFEDVLRHEDNMDGGRAYSALTSSLSMGNKESHWVVVCSCHVLILQQLQPTQLWQKSLCEGKVAPHPKAVALKIGEFTSWARYGNREAWPLKAVLGCGKPCEKKERKGKVEKATTKTHQLLTELGMLAKSGRLCGQPELHSDILSWKP